MVTVHALRKVLGNAPTGVESRLVLTTVVADERSQSGVARRNLATELLPLPALRERLTQAGPPL
jgi:hypothetical protein